MYSVHLKGQIRVRGPPNCKLFKGAITWSGAVSFFGAEKAISREFKDDNCSKESSRVAQPTGNLVIVAAGSSSQRI
jgi:hypothetical protein